MASVAATILDNLVTKLKTIKQSASFSIDVEVVEQFKLPNLNESENQPMISILPGEDTTVVRDATNFRKNFDVELFVFVANEKNLDNVLQELLDDIHVLIYAPINLGTNCLAVEILNTSDFFLSNESKQAGAIVNLQIIYYATKAAF